ncbi:MAG: NADH-quinone oxidoreductase subunit NuoF [Anaerolineae bacterium]|nr:NADH-quinone oxidoreductase subunit NuoF [Anaerolineae bacterium]
MVKHILLQNRDIPNIDRLDVYEQHGGWETWRKAVTEMQPQAIADTVKASGLRGRGGAGFPTGVKWGFLPKGVFPRYMVVNADESEPGTFKDREIMEGNPHLFLEGTALSTYAIQSNAAYIYVRGEYYDVIRCLEQAIADAKARGYLGQNLFGTSYSLEIYVHSGAGAYICGEETALLNSLEGQLGQPRLKPPFPAAVGLYGKPTIINNVETLANVQPIIANGADWYRQWGTERSPGIKIFCLSGNIKRPGNYELPLATTFRELIEVHGGGTLDGAPIKAILPAGASAPIMAATDQVLDTPMDYESVPSVGSQLGSASMIILSQNDDVPLAAAKMVRFFRHESCGKCTPCREGTYWAQKVLDRIVAGQGTPEDITLVENIANQMVGRCFCPLGEFSTSPMLFTIKHFRDEFLAQTASTRPRRAWREVVPLRIEPTLATKER